MGAFTFGSQQRPELIYTLARRCLRKAENQSTTGNLSPAIRDIKGKEMPHKTELTFGSRVKFQHYEGVWALGRALCLRVLGSIFCTESLRERGESSLGQPTSTCSSGSGSGSTSSSIESYSSLEPSFSFLCRLTLSSRLFLSSCQSQEEKEKMKYVPLRKNALKIDHRNQRTISIKLTFTKAVQPMCHPHFEDEKIKGQRATPFWTEQHL